MVTIFTDENTNTQVIGAYGELSTNQPEQMIIELIRDYLAEFRPQRFMPNWDQTQVGDRVECLTICTNSETYMEENFLLNSELEKLSRELRCVSHRTDPEPDDPREFLKDFEVQAHRETPEWNDLPEVMRRRFTDYYHHSIGLQEDGKLSWLDVEMMLTFGQRHGYFTGMPLSLEKRPGPSKGQGR